IDFAICWGVRPAEAFTPKCLAMKDIVCAEHSSHSVTQTPLSCEFRVPGGRFEPWLGFAAAAARPGTASATTTARAPLRMAASMPPPPATAMVRRRLSGAADARERGLAAAGRLDLAVTRVCGRDEPGEQLLRRPGDLDHGLVERRLVRTRRLV